MLILPSYIRIGGTVKKVDQMSDVEMRGELKRLRTVLRRIAKCDDGFLAQTYMQFAEDALEAEHSMIRRYPNNERVPCSRCGKFIKLCVDGSLWEHKHKGLHCNGTPVDEREEQV